MADNVFSGKTVDEAVEAGLKELGCTRDDVEIEVLEEGKKKLFGSVPAQVRLSVKQSDGARAVTFLEGLFRILGQEVTVTLVSEDEKIEIELASASKKGVIGRRGEMIDAVQNLAGAVANTGRKSYRRVVVDCGNYREDREETLKHVAQKMAAKAIRQGRRVKLEPMNPYERRIIHSALMDNEEVTTKSEGKEPMRQVVIYPKNPHGSRDGRKRGDRDRGYDRSREKKKEYPKRDLPKESTPQSSGTGFKRGGFSGFFGTFLGNSRDDEPEETPTPDEE